MVLEALIFLDIYNIIVYNKFCLFSYVIITSAVI